MKYRTNWLVLAIAAIALFGLIGWTSHAQSSSKTTFEYQIVTILQSQASEELNALGAQGWELVTMEQDLLLETKNSRDYYYRKYFFKRAK